MNICRLPVLAVLVLLLVPVVVSGADNTGYPDYSVNSVENGGIYEYTINVAGVPVKTGYYIETFPAEVTLVSSSLPEESIAADGNRIFIAVTGEDSYDFTIETDGRLAGGVDVEWSDLVDGSSGTYVYNIGENGEVTTAGQGTGTSTGTPAAAKTNAPVTGSSTQSSPGFGIIAAVFSCGISAAVYVYRRNVR